MCEMPGLRMRKAADRTGDSQPSRGSQPGGQPSVRKCLHQPGVWAFQLLRMCGPPARGAAQKPTSFEPPLPISARLGRISSNVVGFCAFLRKVSSNDVEKCAFLREFCSMRSYRDLTKWRRDGVYHLADTFTLFHLKPIEPRRAGSWGKHVASSGRSAWVGTRSRRTARTTQECCRGAPPSLLACSDRYGHRLPLPILSVGPDRALPLPHPLDDALFRHGSNSGIA